MGIKLPLLILLLATTLPLLFSRIRLIYTIETNNHPSKLTKPRGWITEKGSYEVRYREKLRNCEDVVLDAKVGYAVLSCDEGRDGWNTVMGVFTPNAPLNTGTLWLYDYARSTPTLESIRILNTPPSYSFHPLGLSLHTATNTLLIANHGLSGSTLDQYHFSRHGNSATYIRSISSPFLRSPNAIVQISDYEVLVTNDHFFTARGWGWVSKVETYFGLSLGSVVHVDLKTGEVNQVARVAFANGITMLDSNTIAIASSSTTKILLFDIDRNVSPPTLSQRSTFSVPFLPDNIHATPPLPGKNSTLLIAGHAHLSSLAKFSAQRATCGADTTSKRCDTVAPSYVVQWSEEKGLQEVYVGSELATSSSAVWDRKRGVLVVSGLYGKGLMVWRGEGEEVGKSFWRDVDGRV